MSDASSSAAVDTASSSAKKTKSGAAAKDYTAQTNDAIRDTQQALDTRGADALEESLDRILNLEKQCRQSGDGENVTKLLAHVVHMCVQAKAWDRLVVLCDDLSKKRNQIKQGIAKLVQEAMAVGIEKAPDRQTREKLITELRKITEGKIYVEVERARLIRMLTEMREQDGKLQEAAELLQEVQVETVGSMEAQEKIEFVLEQMRLCLDVKDYVRAFLISKKVTKRTLSNEAFQVSFEHFFLQKTKLETNITRHVNASPKQDLKIRYYNLMIRYYSYKRDYLEICRCYFEIYETPKVQQDQSFWSSTLQNMIVYIILAPFDNHQHDIMHRIWADKKLEEAPLKLHRELLRLFVSGEVIDWPQFQQRFGAVLRKSPALATDQQAWSDLHDRIVETDIRIVSKYYERIQSKRLADLLHLGEDKTEEFLSRLVSSKTISAKIDRIAGIIRFKKPQEKEDILNAWSNDIVDLLGKVEKANHLVEAQRAVHVKAKGKK